MERNTYNSLEKSSSSVLKVVALFLGCMIFFSLLLSYAAFADYTLAGFLDVEKEKITVSDITLNDSGFVIYPESDGDSSDAEDESPKIVEYFSRNQVFLRIAMAVLCLLYVKRNSKEYHIGLSSLADRRAFFLLSIALVVVAFFYSFVKMSWLPYLFNPVVLHLVSSLCDAILVVFGLYLLRKSHAKLWVKAVVAVSGLLLFYAVFMGMHLLMGVFSTADSPWGVFNLFIEVSYRMTDVWFLIVSALSALFVGIYYLYTNRIVESILIPYLFKLSVSSLSIGGLAGGTGLQVPNTIGVSEFFFFAGGAVCALVPIGLLIVLLVKKNAPGDELCEYQPLQESRQVDTLHELLHEREMQLLAILSSCVFINQFISLFLSHIEEWSISFLDFLEGRWIVSLKEFSNGTTAFDFYELLNSILEQSAVLIILPVLFLVFEFWLFYIRKDTRYVKKSLILKTVRTVFVLLILLTLLFPIPSSLAAEVSLLHLGLIGLGLILVLVAICYLIHRVSDNLEQKPKNHERSWMFSKLACIGFIVLNLVFLAMFLSSGVQKIVSNLPADVVEWNHLIVQFTKGTFAEPVATVLFSAVTVLLTGYLVAWYLTVCKLQRGVSVPKYLYYPILCVSILFAVFFFGFSVWSLSARDALATSAVGLIFVALSVFLKKAAASNLSDV